jgi:ribosomal protein S12 methylthiotransferase
MNKTASNPRRKKSVALITFGCAKNLVDSEAMLGYLRRAGYALLPNPKKADIIVLNTCGFIRPAREEAAQAIEEALTLKARSGQKTVVVAGCFVERCGPELKAQYPGVDAWLGVKDFDQIAAAVELEPYRRRKTSFLCSHTTPRLLSTPRTWAYLKISEGCSHRCSFCAIPLIKGPYRSRTLESILEEARALVRRGVSEINLISQDTTYFGRDRGMKAGLVKLLSRLIDVAGLRWIRLLYDYPEEITPALLEIMQEDKICAYLDIPFQHAEPRLLRRMKRSIDGRRALILLGRIRKALPDIAVRTSLIVGFPGEGRKELEGLKRFVRAAYFDHLGVFTYSSERGTNAYALGDIVPEKEKQRRRDEIMSIQAGISTAINQKYLGRRLEVLIDDPAQADGKELAGRTRYQAPEVDGVVFLRRNRSLSRPLRPIEQVEITAAEVYDLHGIIA